jgi:hypothetical protein
MMHCHNLVHEDHDMMVQLRVDDANNAAEFDPDQRRRGASGPATSRPVET